jgi:hypothetical protein
MIFTKKWFSLIEVVIATSIISITVFWVYKLIWENTKIITNSTNYLQVTSLFPVMEECIENKINNFPLAIWTNKDFYLDSNLNDCQLINSWTIIDNITYYLSAKVMESWNNYNKWQISIWSDEVKTKTWIYLQIKK